MIKNEDSRLVNFNPYLLLPRRQIGSQIEYHAWKGLLIFWLSPQQPVDKDDLAFRNYCQILIQEFIRNEFSSELPKLYKIPQGFTQWFRLEAKLLESLLSLMEHMRTMGSSIINEPMALLIHRLITERRIVVFYCPKSDFNSIGGDGANDLIRTIQNQNKRIRNVDNPFPVLPNELSGRLIQSAIEIGERNDQFKKNFVNPVVDARAALSAHIRESKPLMHINGVPKNKRPSRQKKSSD
jgi:hypothetical protein